MKSRIKASFAVVVLSTLVVVVTSGTVVRAGHTGTTLFVEVSNADCTDGSGAGGESTPFCSIQAAVDHAVSGDILVVAAGVYEERFVISTPNLTLLGANAGVHGSSGSRGSETRINGMFPTSGAIRVEADGVVMDGFEFDQINEGIQVGYLGDGVRNLVIANSRIFGAAEFGVSIFAGEDSEITRNHIENNGSGVDIVLGTARLRFNNFVNNQTAGVRAFAAFGGPAVSVDARLNWWGHVSGPGVDTGGGVEGPGLGDRVSTFVDFVPYCTTPAPDCETSFVDSAESVHSTDINRLAVAGITRGCNPPENDRFCPDDFVTRGQIAAFLVRSLGLSMEAAVGFVDVEAGSTFEADINKLAAAGITRGCNPPVNDRFCPDDFVTRGQMAAFLVRALGLTDDGGGDLFVDDDDSIFEGDIDRLGTAGITRGCNPPENDRYCPDDFVTRAQMASFLVRALGL